MWRVFCEYSARSMQMRCVCPDASLPVEQVVILFSGGSGNVRLRPGSLRPEFAGRGNFLVRTRYLWAGDGFASVVVDVPSDRAEQGA